MFFPSYEIPQKIENDISYIWDGVRRKWLIFTPEELVRQHLLHYLVSEKKIPVSLISVEREIKLYKKKKRFDVMVYDNQGKPLILCECKAPHIALSQETIYQIGYYNQVLAAPFLLLTNGEELLFFQINADDGFDRLEF